MAIDTTFKIPRNLYDRTQQIAQNEQRDIVDILTEALAKGLPILDIFPHELSDRELAKKTFRHLHPQFLANYPDQYVAIHQDKVVDHDPDRVALLERINSNYPDTFILVRQVRPEPEVTYEHHGLRWGQTQGLMHTLLP